MRVAPLLLSVVLIACESNDVETDGDSLIPVDSPAAARSGDVRRPTGGVGDSTAAVTPVGEALGKEPGTIPASPTPTVTSESAIVAMRSSMQQLDAASAQQLRDAMSRHQKMLGDLLTTMRVEVQATSSAAKDAWLAAADSVEGDLNRLAVSQGEELRTAFREHRTRSLRLLDQFRVLVPARP